MMNNFSVYLALLANCGHQSMHQVLQGTLRGPAYVKTASPINHQNQWNRDIIIDSTFKNNMIFSLILGDAVFTCAGPLNVLAHKWKMHKFRASYFLINYPIWGIKKVAYSVEFSQTSWTHEDDEDFLCVLEKVKFQILGKLNQIYTL